VADGVEAAGVVFAAFLVEARPSGDVDLAAENGLDPGRPCLVVELERTEEVAMVRHPDGRHADAADPLEERVELDGAVEKRVLGVEVEMDELARHAHSHSIVEGGLEETS
jgi:hypothetical protein